MTQLSESSSLGMKTDVVIFTLSGQHLRVLLRRLPDRDEVWCFPGGSLHADEELDASARRVLTAVTGLADVYVEQLYTFGRADAGTHSAGITVAYYALVPMDRCDDLRAPADTALSWYAIDNLPALMPGLDKIIATARERLAAKLNYTTIGFQFLPRMFTLSQLQAVYEIVQDSKLDKRNFRKRMLALGRFDDTGKMTHGGPHRPARLYRLKFPHRVEIIK